MAKNGMCNGRLK